jgi:hypothetical protein
LSQLLVRALGDKIECIQLVDIEGMTQTRPGDYFADYTKTGATNDDVKSLPIDECEQGLMEDEEKVVAKNETIIQFFLDCLPVTGRDLAPTKCAWYLISHRWKDGIHRLLRTNPTHRGIQIVSKSTGTAAGIKIKAPEEGHGILGFRLAGDGTSTAHKKVMTDKLVMYCEAIAQSTLRRGESGMEYNSFYMPILANGTPMTSLTFKECTNVQKSVVNAILPKMGINRKAPRAVVFGTSKYDELELDHLAAVQGFGCLQYLMGNLRCQDSTGKLIQMRVEFTQLECLSLEPMFTLDYEEYMTTILTRNWVTEIWAYLGLCKGKLNISGMRKPAKPWEGDQALVEIAVKTVRSQTVK